MLITRNFFKNDELRAQKIADKDWALRIKGRDNWTCAVCGDNYKPNAHHIIPRENKEYRYFDWNGLTLCTTHHKFSRKISAHNAPFAFFLWLRKYKPLTYEIVEKEIKGLLGKEGIVL